jgi:hypothetical protein
MSSSKYISVGGGVPPRFASTIALVLDDVQL